MSMTIQEAIDKISLSLYSSEINYKRTVSYGYFEAAEELKKYVEAEQMAIEALREKAEREDPQPLTENDLLHMHGQPVYVAERRAYGIVSVAYGSPFVDMLDFSSIGCRCPGYHFYRHKPKEEI